MGEQRYISVTAAARRLDVDGETIRRWIKTGKLAAIQLPSGQYRVASAQVEKILTTPYTPPDTFNTP